MNIKFIEDYYTNMDKDKTTLEDIALHINQLIAKEGKEKIVEKSGIDKNILYRLSTGGNTNLDKYLKIKNAFPSAFRTPQESKLITDCPILGQIIEDNKVKLLNMAQPTSFKMLTNTFKLFTPVFGYLSLSSSAYTGCVHLFSTANINPNSIGKQCINRMVMVYPEDGNPLFGLIMNKSNKIFELLHPISREVLMTIPVNNKLNWSKWLSIMPFSFAENIKPDETTDNLQHDIDDKYIQDVQAIGKHLRTVFNK